MKRIISALLCFLLCFSGMAAFSETADTADSKAAEVLTALDILDESELDLIELTGGMRRLDFVKYIARILGISEFTEVYEHYYTDMEGNSAEGLINEMTKRGYLSVPDNRLFRPDDAITCEEACKILVILCGYEPVAEVNGGFPMGYLYIAKMTEIIPKGMQGTELTASEAFELLLNALETPTYDPLYIKLNESGEHTIAYSSEAHNNTLLAQLYDVYGAEGFAEAAGGASYTGTVPESGELVIGGEKFIDTTGRIYLEDYIGRYLELYYRQTDKNAAKELVYLTDVTEEYEDQVFETDAELIADSTSGSTLRYYKDETSGKTGEVKMADNIRLVYNGKLIEYDLWNYFKDIEHGFVRLTDMDDDGIFEYGYIKSYKDFIVKFADNNKGCIYDKWSTDSHDFNSYEYAKVYMEDYSEISLGNLSEGMILSIASYPGVYFEAIVAGSTVKGQIERVLDNGEEFRVMIDGSEYEVATRCKTKLANMLRAGNFGTFYLNAFGDIAYADFDAGAYIFGILCKAANTYLPDNNAILKVFSEDGNIYEFECAEKIKIDGVVKQGFDEIVAAIPNTSGEAVEPQMIRYKAADNIISEIDTMYFNNQKESKNNALFETVQVSDYYNSADQAYYHQGTNVRGFGMSTLINANTVVFIIPPVSKIKDGTAADNQYNIGSLTTFVADRRYTISSYKTNYKGGFEEALIYQNSEQLTPEADSNFLLVDKVYTSITDDGRTVHTLSGMMGGNLVEVNVSDEYNFDAVTPRPDTGDTVLVRLNPSGEIGEMQVFYDYSVGGTPDKHGLGWESANLYHTTHSTVSRRAGVQYGFVYPGFKDGAIVKCYYSNTADTENDAPDETYNMNHFNIMVYDDSLRESKVYLGTIDDILDIDSVGGANCSSILLKKAYSLVKDVVVYK